MRAVRSGRLVVVVVVLALYGCGGGGDPQPVLPKIEVTMAREGGLCITDEGGALCGLFVTVRNDGTWTARGTQPPAPAEGAVEPGAAGRLAALLDEGWETLTAQPFEGTCPTAYDGQEVTLTVRRLPAGPDAPYADAEVREARSCTHDFGRPGARDVLERFERLWRELGLPV